MGYILRLVVDFTSQALIWIIIAQFFLAYIFQPDHPIRVAIDRLVLPLLNPIRRVVPLIRVPIFGLIDISPMILIILVQLIAWLLTFLITITMLPR